MLECLVLGDSIAQGIGSVRTECVSYAQKGTTSYTWNNKNLHRDLSAKTVVISLGANDHEKINTFREILTLRQLVTAHRVYWILPANNLEVQDIIRIIANSYQDTVLEIPVVSKDKIHPTTKSYKELANYTRAK